MAPERFFLDTDGDSHWYVVPCSKEAEWDAWCQIGEQDPDNEDGWEAPEWAKPVGGSPTRVTFTDPEIP